jgi:hypothetical protein
MSHISLPNGVTKLSIPPHSFHRMQPLDVTLYGPLKKAYNYECQLFMKVHPNEKLTPSDLPTLFSKAYGHVATVEKATKGFECTGIFPVNPNIFPEEMFAVSDLLTQQNNDANNENNDQLRMDQNYYYQEITIQFFQPL